MQFKFFILFLALLCLPTFGAPHKKNPLPPISGSIAGKKAPRSHTLPALLNCNGQASKQAIQAAISTVMSSSYYTYELASWVIYRTASLPKKLLIDFPCYTMNYAINSYRDRQDSLASDKQKNSRDALRRTGGKRGLRTAPTKRNSDRPTRDERVAKRKATQCISKRHKGCACDSCARGLRNQVLHKTINF